MGRPKIKESICDPVDFQGSPHRAGTPEGEIVTLTSRKVQGEGVRKYHSQSKGADFRGGSGRFSSGPLVMASGKAIGGDARK